MKFMVGLLEIHQHQPPASGSTSGSSLITGSALQTKITGNSPFLTTGPASLSSAQINSLSGQEGGRGGPERNKKAALSLRGSDAFQILSIPRKSAKESTSWAKFERRKWLQQLWICLFLPESQQKAICLSSF